MVISRAAALYRLLRRYAWHIATRKPALPRLLPATQAVCSLMAQEKQMPAAQSLVFPLRHYIIAYIIVMKTVFWIWLRFF